MQSEIQDLLKMYLKRINNLKVNENDKSESKLYTIITLRAVIEDLEKILENSKGRNENK
jgi:sugar-specific transcriptional regulator TrmB